jgi:MoaA/NifB/PqqE/SkfB family radical SAM enzyme
MSLNERKKTSSKMSKPTKLTKPHPLFSLQNWKTLFQGRLPGQVVIQYTDQCNATCVQCGMRMDNKFQRTTLNIDDTKRLLDAMAARSIQAVSFTGGEPLLYLKQIVPCMHHAHQVGIKYIRTGTNGFIFKNHHRPDFAAKMAELAETLVNAHLYTFWISIDSAIAEVHEKNRGLPGVIAGIEKALPIFHAHGIYPSANLGINRYIGGYEQAPYLTNHSDIQAFYQHFRQAFRDFYAFVKSLGFTIVNACYPMSLDEESAKEMAIYSATSIDNIVRFQAQEKQLIFQALFDTIPAFRDQLRIFTPRSSLLALIRQYQGDQASSYPCRGGIDFFFIDSKDMNTYPCGYRGEDNLGKFWDLNLNHLDTKAWCKQCDWECFRDPSEIAGPLLEMLRHPFKLWQRFRQDKEYAKLWYDDIKYYQACDYFNATLPPNWKKLSRFAQKQSIEKTYPSSSLPTAVMNESKN